LSSQRVRSTAVSRGGWRPYERSSSIDFEGHETKFFAASLHRWQPLLILIEYHVNNLQTHRLFEKERYRLIRRLGHNGGMFHANSRYRIALVRLLEFGASIITSRCHRLIL